MKIHITNFTAYFFAYESRHTNTFLLVDCMRCTGSSESPTQLPGRGVRVEASEVLVQTTVNQSIV